MHFKHKFITLIHKAFINIYSQFHSFLYIAIQWNYIQNKISPNTGTLLNGVLLPNLLNNPFPTWFLTNLDFLLLHIAHFDNIIPLPLLKNSWIFFISIFSAL